MSADATVSPARQPLDEVSKKIIEQLQANRANKLAAYDARHFEKSWRGLRGVHLATEHDHAEHGDEQQEADDLYRQ